MSEAAVTVVHCCRCRRSAELTLTGGRFWCGWCQEWAEIEAERVSDVRMERAGSEPRLAPVPPAVPPRQPLRIPSGWMIEYHNFHELDPSSADDWRMQHDLLIAVHEARGRLVDVSWYFGDADSGSFRLVVWAPGYDGELQHTFLTLDRAALVAEVERVLEEVAKGRL